MVFRWRTIEWCGVILALFLQTGAIVPLLFSDPNDPIGRLILLLAYAVTIVLLVRHVPQLVLLLRRNAVFFSLHLLPFLSMLWSISPSLTLRRAIALLLSAALSWLLAIRFTPDQILLLIAAVLLPSMLLSVAAIFVLPSIALMPDSMDAWRGVFVHKNVLGWHASVATLAAAFVIARELLPRPLGIVMLLSGLFCLAASASMTSILSIIVAAGLTVFYVRLARAAGAGRLLFIVLFMQFAAALAILMSEFFVPTLEGLGKDATLTGRIPLWRLEDAAIFERLLTGYGYSAFWSDGSSLAWYIRGEIGWGAPNAHNGYREVLLGTGLVGLVPLIFVVVRGLGQGGALLLSCRDEGWLWLNVYAGMFLVMNLTESILFTPYSLHFIIYSTALCMFGLRAPQSQRRTTGIFLRDVRPISTTMVIRR